MITDILHIFENGHNVATALPIDVLVGARVRFLAEPRFLP